MNILINIFKNLSNKFGRIKILIIIFIIILIILFIIALGVYKVYDISAPGSPVSFWFISFTKKDDESEGKTKDQLKNATKKIQQIEKENNENKIKFENELIVLKKENEKLNTIIKKTKISNDLQNKYSKDIDNIKNDISLKNKIINENIEKMKDLNNKLSLDETNCIPVEKIVTVCTSGCDYFGQQTYEYKTVKNIDKKSCYNASSLKKEVEILQSSNTFLADEIKKLYDRINNLEQCGKAQ